MNANIDALREALATNGRQCLNPKCLSRGRRRRVMSRGLCSSCNRAAHRAVEAGRVTWERLIREGVCLPAGEQRVRRI